MKGKMNKLIKVLISLLIVCNTGFSMMSKEDMDFLDEYYFLDCNQRLIPKENCIDNTIFIGKVAYIVFSSIHDNVDSRLLPNTISKINSDELNTKLNDPISYLKNIVKNYCIYDPFLEEKLNRKSTYDQYITLDKQMQKQSEEVQIEIIKVLNEDLRKDAEIFKSLKNELLAMDQQEKKNIGKFIYNELEKHDIKYRNLKTILENAKTIHDIIQKIRTQSSRSLPKELIEYNSLVTQRIELYFDIIDIFNN